MDIWCSRLKTVRKLLEEDSEMQWTSCEFHITYHCLCSVNDIEQNAKTLYIMLSYPAGRFSVNNSIWNSTPIRERNELSQIMLTEMNYHANGHTMPVMAIISRLKNCRRNRLSRGISDLSRIGEFDPLIGDSCDFTLLGRHPPWSMMRPRKIL